MRYVPGTVAAAVMRTPPANSLDLSKQQALETLIDYPIRQPGRQAAEIVERQTWLLLAAMNNSIVSRIFRTFGLAERHPALTQAVMAPLICWSLSSSRYLFVDHAVPAMWRSLAAARLSADWPSGNAPTTRVRRLISRRMRSSGLLTGMRS